jgi:hypothetical protein
VADGFQPRDDGQQLALGAGQVDLQQVPEPAGGAAELACFLVDPLLPAPDLLQPFPGLLDRPGVRRAVLLPAAGPAGLELGLVLLQPGLPAAGLGRQRRAGHLDLAVTALGHAPLGIPEPDQRLVEPLQRIEVGVDLVRPPGPRTAQGHLACPRSVSARRVPAPAPAPAPVPMPVSR